MNKMTRLSALFALLPLLVPIASAAPAKWDSATYNPATDYSDVSFAPNQASGGQGGYGDFDRKVGIPVKWADKEPGAEGGFGGFQGSAAGQAGDDGLALGGFAKDGRGAYGAVVGDGSAKGKAYFEGQFDTSDNDARGGFQGEGGSFGRPVDGDNSAAGADQGNKFSSAGYDMIKRTSNALAHGYTYANGKLHDIFAAADHRQASNQLDQAATAAAAAAAAFKRGAECDKKGGREGGPNPDWAQHLSDGGENSHWGGWRGGRGGQGQEKSQEQDQQQQQQQPAVQEEVHYVTEIVDVTVTAQPKATDNARKAPPPSQPSQAAPVPEAPKPQPEAPKPEQPKPSPAPAPAPASAPASAPRTGNIPADQKEWIDMHNSFRAKHGAGPVGFSQGAYDQAKANFMANKGTCNLVHTKDGGYGENLAMMGYGEIANQSLMGMWTDEAKNYCYKEDCPNCESCFFERLMGWQIGMKQ